MDNKKSIFIKFGHDRIKASNIKSYGIANGSDEFLKEVEDCDYHIKHYMKSYERERKEDFKRYTEEYKQKKDELINSKAYSLALNNKYVYLYVTTYQDDNYEYYIDECGFDIYQKLEEMDSILC